MIEGKRHSDAGIEQSQVHRMISNRVECRRTGHLADCNGMPPNLGKRRIGKKTSHLQASCFAISSMIGEERATVLRKRVRKAYDCKDI